MSLFGKILALLNVFAAVGFLYLATQDWTKRQTWHYAVLRHELAMHGLPVDEGPAPPGVPDTLIADNLHAKALQDLFQRVGGRPSRTQIAEVQQKQTELQDRFRNLPDETARRKEVGDILLSLAPTAAERDAVAQRLSDKTVTTDTLITELDRRFQDALRTENAAGQPRDPEEHRRAIAALLYNLSNDPAWHQRVQVVVGLNAYGREADLQGAVLKEMVTRQQLAMASERADFENQYRQLIQSRLELLARQVEDLEQVRKEQMDLKTKHQGVVDARKTVRDELDEQLKHLKKTINDVLAHQHKLENEVFQAQRELATAAEQNLQMERQIRSLEQGR